MAPFSIILVGEFCVTIYSCFIYCEDKALGDYIKRQLA